jgi:dTDP-4-dehydrorhamnose reductase
VKVLVLGASGLLGNTVFRELHGTTDWDVIGAMRTATASALLPHSLAEQVALCGDLENQTELEQFLTDVAPDVVINCLSLPKQELREDNFRKVIAGLAVLPQHLSVACARIGARLIHFSSDAVFSGRSGGYSEADSPDATDAYGIAKFLGEVGGSHAVSIRTSLIGPALRAGHGLLEWFLSQDQQCTCFTRAIFSGLPTIELARILRDVLLPRADLFGVYHVAAAPISKFDLLRLVADVYGKTIELVPDDRVVIDRSLNADRFRAATGYVCPPWPELIRSMHEDHLQRVTAII